MSGPHDPEAEEQISDRVDKDARTETAGAIGYEVVEGAGNRRRDPVRRGMRKGEAESHGDEGEPRKCAEGNVVKFFVNEIAQEETAPKNFLHERDNDGEPEKAKTNRAPIRDRAGREQFRVKPIQTRAFSEKELWRNPDYKNQNSDRDMDGMKTRLNQIEIHEQVLDGR